jgi:uncharacterized membrane protein YbhN (UPF0104 family)
MRSVVSLLFVFGLFCLLMAALLAFCLRERHRQRHEDGSGGQIDAAESAHFPGLGSTTRAGESRGLETISLYSPAPSAVDEAADQRVALAVFGSIIAGLLLALVTAYLVIYANWNG